MESAQAGDFLISRSSPDLCELELSRIDRGCETPPPDYNRERAGAYGLTLPKGANSVEPVPGIAMSDLTPYDDVMQ
jgi:hypothetical protein